MFSESDKDPFQTLTLLRQILGGAGLRPRKRMGQHFLIDRNLMQKLVDAAELGADDCVLEVGAGTGSLTALLARSSARVVAVEMDRELIGLAEEQLAARENVTFLQVDALENKSTVSSAVCSAVREAHARAGGALMLVANLPFDIATPLILNLLLGDLPISRYCFTVQAEVADRFLAEPARRDYGPVSIVTQVLARSRRICRVPAQAFWPVPKVQSAMLCLDVRCDGAASVGDPASFSRFVRSFFQHRRKTVRHLVKQREDAARLEVAMGRLGIQPGARPENLAVGQWVELFGAVR